MNRWSKLLLAPIFTAIALLPLRAQQQPIVGVTIEAINVGGGVNFTVPGGGFNPLTFSGGTTYGNAVGGTLASTLVNESSGPSGVPIYIGAYATGTNLIGSYIYTFYVNGLSIGSSSSAVHPPNRDVAYWTPPQPGSYFLTVKAADGLNTAVSLPIRYFATGTVVNSPVDGQLVPNGSSVVIKADATVAGGFIKQIQFYDSINGGAPVSIGVDTTLPYSVIYTPPGGAGSTHDITAQATDNNGALVTVSAAIRLNVGNAITPLPTCTLTSPANGSIIGIPTTGNAIPVLVDAYSNGRISKVELYIDGELFGTNTNFPYTFSWAPTVVGTYNLVALAYDDKNNVISSTVSTVKIAPPPTVAVTYPMSGDTVTGGSPTRLTAVASDSNVDASGNPVKIRSVQFFVDTEFVGECTTPDANGVYFVTATLTQKVDPNGAPIPSKVNAIATDSVGISGTSPTATVNVTKGGGGTAKPPVGNPPTISITSPVASTLITVNTPVLLASNPVDTDGFITSVQYIAGTTGIATATTYPFTATWTPTSPGSYALTAKTTDNDGNTTNSAVVTVQVVDPTAAQPPTVTVNSPADGSTILVGNAQILKATPTVSGSIQGVQFFVNGQPFGTLITSFPFQTSWTPVSPGSYAIAARVTNASGVQGTSVPVNVTVSGGTAPAVNLTAPTTGATIPVNAAQTLTATATSASGTIASVQFFINGVSVGTDLTFPYSATWTPSGPGTFSIFARATDNLGNTTDSATSTVTVAGGAAPTVSVTFPLNNSTYTVATPLTLNATAADSDGTVVQVQFLVNGVPQGIAATKAPYTGTWTPAASGPYTVTAQATDNSGNVTTSAPITVNINANGAPTVSMVTPKTGATASASTPLTLTAAAADADGQVAQVRFFANGSLVGSTVLVAPFTTNWTPTSAGTYSVYAEATDNSGNVSNSAPILLTVVANQPPIVSLTSPGAGFATSSGLSVVLAASATDNDGSIAKVRFLVNGVQIGAALTLPPYSATWTPTSAGTFSVVAEATDNTGNVSTSTPVSVSVIGNHPPTVSITSPNNGSTVRVGAATTLVASAKDSDGNVASVQFYLNGSPLGLPVTIFPYSTTWTPAAEGVYRITAVATDNAGASASAPTVSVLAVSAVSISSDRVYGGAFSGPGDTGKFTLIISGTTATLIGYSTLAPTTLYYVPDMTVDAGGSFSGSDAGGHQISGTANDTGVAITIGQTTSVGMILNGSSPIPAGRYSGSIAAAPGSSIDAIVGSTGTIMVYLVNGSSVDVAAGTLTTAGTTAAPMTSVLSGSKITISINPVTTFLTGTITGPNAGTLAGALATGSTFSDGSLRNLSTRGQVGVGDNVLIAGFVVGGDTPKQVLIRAIGPSLAPFGITSPLADPMLTLYKKVDGGSVVIGSNDNWENNFDIVTASSVVGAFPVSPTSKDSALLVTLAPGNYTAQVSGVGNATGIALVELYDVDNVAPFAVQKVINISTRGLVGSDQSQLIAGFIVGGNIPKKVLIRAVGPTLASYGVTTGYLADPLLQLNQIIPNKPPVLIRENNDWSQGNDAALVMDAATKTGAFPLNAGSKDAAILISLPPGTYSAQVTGANSSTGIALVEVYELP